MTIQRPVRKEWDVRYDWWKVVGDDGRKIADTPIEAHADAIVAALNDEIEGCMSCFGTGQIDSDGFCGNCETGRLKAANNVAQKMREALDQIANCIEEKFDGKPFEDSFLEAQRIASQALQESTP